MTSFQLTIHTPSDRETQVIGEAVVAKIILTSPRLNVLPLPVLVVRSPVRENPKGLHKLNRRQQWGREKYGYARLSKIGNLEHPSGRQLIAVSYYSAVLALPKAVI